MTYQNNEKVVIAETLKTGVVLQVNEGEQQVEIQFEDGTSRWHDYNDVKKLLIETDPKESKTRLW
jgi:hypothetical protein